MPRILDLAEDWYNVVQQTRSLHTLPAAHEPYFK